MSKYLFVFLGGGLGAVLRLVVNLLFASTSLASYPIATLTVNVLGSFLIGIFGALLLQSPSELVRYFLIIGLCGGFTTFSAFSNELFSLCAEGYLFKALGYVLLSVTLSLLATYCGYRLLS